MIAVGRHINGITLNPLEWLLDGEGGDIMTFESEEAAKEYLRQFYTEDEIYFMTFEEVEENSGWAAL